MSETLSTWRFAYRWNRLQGNVQQLVDRPPTTCAPPLYPIIFGRMMINSFNTVPGTSKCQDQVSRTFWLHLFIFHTRNLPLRNLFRNSVSNIIKCLCSFLVLWIWYRERLEKLLYSSNEQGNLHYNSLNIMTSLKILHA